MLSQVSIHRSYCLFWMMDTTLSITQQYRRSAHLIARKPQNRMAYHLTPWWRYTFLSPWHTILAVYYSWNYGRSLFLSDLSNIPRLISLHYVPTLLLFPFNSSTWKLSWWRHQMETFSALLALCAGNSPVTGVFDHKGQWRGALMFSLICTWIND